MSDALTLADGLVRRWEAYRAWPYPDPYSPLALATRGKPWGFASGRSILNTLSPDVRALSGKPWTVGFGDTGPAIGPDSPQWSEPLARTNLLARLEEVQEGVRRLVHVPLQPHQEAALISFAYNVGLDEDADTKAEGLGDSSLLRYVNARDFDAAAGQFGKWIYAAGHKSTGLIHRRECERVMFLGFDPTARAGK
jgi:lysozyme